MNVYDFDKTIYAGDSTLDFYKFILKKYPKTLFYFPKQLWGQFLYKIKKIDKTEMKEYFYSFISGITDIQKELNEFWKLNEKKIYKWYLSQQKEDDVIISASPEFLLSPICKKIGINNLIASKVDCINGKCQTPNCKGKEKVTRFKQIFEDAVIDEFYSDSLSDLPLASIAEKSYIVYKGKVSEWII